MHPKDRHLWDRRLLRDFLDPYFMAVIRDPDKQSIMEDSEGKVVGELHQKVRRSFRFPLELIVAA